MTERLSRRAVVRGLGVGTVGAMAGCLGSSDGSGSSSGSTSSESGGDEAWPSFRFDSGNTSSTDNTGPTESVSKRWEYQATREIGRSPVVVDGTVVFGSGFTVTALDTADGVRSWTKRTPGILNGAVTTTDDAVIVAPGHEGMVAIDRETREELWQTSFNADRVCNPVVGDGKVYTATESDSLAAVDADSGETEWTFQTDDSVTDSVAVVDGTVVAGSADEHVYAIDAASGSERWRFEMNTSVVDTPVIDDGTVFASTNVLQALDLESGEVLWSSDPEGVPSYGPAVTADSLYFGHNKYSDYFVQAIDRATGEQRWRVELDDHPGTPPTVVDETLYVGDLEGTLYALDTNNGEFRWTFQTESEINVCPVVANGVLYLGTEDQYIYALEEDG